MVSPFLDAQGNTIPEEQILGSGGRAVVILQNGVAIKLPLRCPWSTAYEVQASIDSLQHEQNVYRRLQQPPDDARSSGVVRCVGFAPEATHLANMTNGDLQTYLATTATRPSSERQLQWFLEMAQALDYIHERCVLVADIASRNFLLDAHLSLKLCDFSEASLLPLSSDMLAVDDKGYTTQIDIGLLGAVMYEIATGVQCKVDLYKDDPCDGRACWPARGALPDTEGLALGDIIEGCWSGRFPSAGHLSQALEALRNPAPSTPLEGSAYKEKTSFSKKFSVTKKAVWWQTLYVVKISIHDTADVGEALRDGHSPALTGSWRPVLHHREY